MTGSSSSKEPFSLPLDFTDNPTEAPFPRQLIIYEEKTNTWSPTVDENTIVNISYLCVSYRQSDFLSRQQLEDTVQDVCHQLGLKAYWLDYACTGESQEEKNRDLYRIADVFRGAAKTLIMIKGDNINLHSPGWLSWGGRLWTLPEALLSGYREDKLLYKAGRRPIKSITLRQITNLAYSSRDEMELINAYSGEPVIASGNMFETLCKAIWRRTSGDGSSKDSIFTAYDAERVYALMGFMSRRILPDPSNSEEEAFNYLMKANHFDKQNFYVDILVSAGKSTTSISLQSDGDKRRSEVPITHSNAGVRTSEHQSSMNILSNFFEELLRSSKPKSPQTHSPWFVWRHLVHLQEHLSTAKCIQGAQGSMSMDLQNHSAARPIYDISECETKSEVMNCLDNTLISSNLSVEQLHASFGESPRDEEGYDDFYNDIQKQHKEMAQYCLGVINKKSKFNICKFDNLFVSYEEIDKKDLEMRRQHMGKALHYTCRFWPAHITQMSVNDFEVIQENLEQFLFKHLTQWVEVISILGRTDEAEDALLSLLNWLKNANAEEKIYLLVYECYHLLRCLQEPISSGPFQIYISALPYLPPDSQLLSFYKDYCVLSPSILLGQIEDAKFLKPILPSVSWTTAVAFSPDGTRIATISESGTMLIHDSETFSCIGEPIELKGKYNLIAVSPDGSKVAVVNAQSMYIWNSAQRQAPTHECSIENEILAIAFPNCDHLTSCIRCSTGIEIRELNLHSSCLAINKYRVGESISCAAISPDGGYLGSISSSNSLSIQNIMNHKLDAEHVSLTDFEEDFDVMSVSSNNKYVACGSDRDTIMLWCSQSASIVWTREVSRAIRIIMMPLSLEDKHLVTLSELNETHVWDMASGSCYEHNIYPSKNKAAAISPNGKHCVVTWRWTAQIWAINSNVNSKASRASYLPVLLPGETLKEAIFLADGSLLVCGFGVEENTIIVWERLGTSNASKQTLEGHTSSIFNINISSDGMRLGSRGFDEVILWHRDRDGASFYLHNKHSFEHSDFPSDNAKRAFKKLTQWESRIRATSGAPQITASVLNSQSEMPKLSDNGNYGEGHKNSALFNFGFEGRWMCLNSRKLWYIPECFMGAKITHKGQKIFVYGKHFGILFKYRDDDVHTVLRDGS